MLYVFLSPVQLWPHSNQTIKRLGYFLLFTKKWHLQPPRLRFSGVKRTKKEKSNPLLDHVNHLRTRLLSVNNFTISLVHIIIDYCYFGFIYLIQLNFRGQAWVAWKLHEFELSWRTVASVLNPGQVSNLINLLSFIHIFQVFLVLRSTLILHQPPPSFNRW